MTKSGGRKGGGGKGRGRKATGGKSPASTGETTQQRRDAEPAVEPAEWVVVCVRCMRIKRDGVWTDEKAVVRGGRSTGYCDVCAAKRRDELRIDRK
jgi:hypothetical protein